MYIFLPLLIAIPLVSYAATEKSYPVVWTEEIKLKSLNEIPRLLGSNETGEVLYEKQNGDEISESVAKSCHDYFRLRKQGYYAGNNAAMAGESFFINQCIPLKYLQNARPAKYSYLRQFNVQKDYGRLPAALVMPGWTSDDNPVGTLKQAYSDIEEEKESLLPTSIRLHSKKGESTVHVSLVALGDFNRDGYDDMVISVSNYCYQFQGTYHTYHIYILTQKQKDGPFEEINGNVLIGLKN